MSGGGNIVPSRAAVEGEGDLGNVGDNVRRRLNDNIHATRKHRGGVRAGVGQHFETACDVHLGELPGEPEVVARNRRRSVRVVLALADDADVVADGGEKSDRCKRHAVVGPGHSAIGGGEGSHAIARMAAMTLPLRATREAQLVPGRLPLAATQVLPPSVDLKMPPRRPAAQWVLVELSKATASMTDGAVAPANDGVQSRRAR